MAEAVAVMSADVDAPVEWSLSSQWGDCSFPSGLFSAGKFSAYATRGDPRCSEISNLSVKALTTVSGEVGTV